MVLVNDGTYDTGGGTAGKNCSNRVVITKDIIVKSVNGPENTIILGKGPLGSSAVRGVYMSAGRKMVGFITLMVMAQSITA